MERAGDVAVIGAGLIGLGIAFELASRGATVRVYERGEPARAASWAGAGMLAPYSESTGDEQMLALGAQSLSRYPEFVDRVRAASGIDPHLHLDGIVSAAFDEERLRELRAHAQALARRGVDCELLDRESTLAAEPALARTVLGALLRRSEGYVDNRRLGRALVAACEAKGVTIVRSATDVAVEADARRVLGVRSHLGFTPASYVVVAAGAWSASVPGIPTQFAPAVRPVKGQMLALAAPVGFLKRTTWIPGAYLVPREDGRLLVGATMEDAGFDERVTGSGLRTLLDAVHMGAPSLLDFAVTEVWAGLRPGTPDGRPLIGPTPIEGLILATGHYRNGILLTPVTAAYVADCIERGDAEALAPWLRMTTA